MGNPLEGIGDSVVDKFLGIFDSLDDIKSPGWRKAATIGMSILILGGGVGLLSVMGGGLSIPLLPTASALFQGHFFQAWNLFSSGLGSGFTNPNFLSMLGFPMAVGVVGLGAGLLGREIAGFFGEKSKEVAAKLALLTVPFFITLAGMGLAAYGAHAFPQINNWLYGGLITTCGGAGLMAFALLKLKHVGNSTKTMY